MCLGSSGIHDFVNYGEKQIRLGLCIGTVRPGGSLCSHFLLLDSAASSLGGPLCDVCWFRDRDERELHRRGVLEVEKTGRSFGAVARSASDCSAGSIPQDHDSAAVRPSLRSSYRINQSGDASKELKRQVTTDAAKDYANSKSDSPGNLCRMCDKESFHFPNDARRAQFTHANAESRMRLSLLLAAKLVQLPMRGLTASVCRFVWADWFSSRAR